MVYGMADSCLYNKQNNTWINMDLCEHSKIRKFHISARPSIILYLQENPGGSVRISKGTQKFHLELFRNYDALAQSMS